MKYVEGLQALDTCPNCEASWVDSEIPKEHLLRGYYGAWCESDGPRFFRRLCGVEVRGLYDGVCYWQCPDCSGKWHRFDESDPRHIELDRLFDRAKVNKTSK